MSLMKNYKWRCARKSMAPFIMLLFILFLFLSITPSMAELQLMDLTNSGNINQLDPFTEYLITDGFSTPAKQETRETGLKIKTLGESVAATFTVLNPKAYFAWSLDQNSAITASKTGFNPALDSSLQEVEDNTEGSIGVVYSFGEGFAGKLGHGDTSDRSTPTKIENLAGVKAIAAGGYHSLVLLENGDVYSFGAGLQLGHGDISDRTTPTKIESLAGVKAIAVGEDHSLVLLENGEVYSFGDSGYGQLGHQDNNPRATPTKIENLAGVKAIAAGYGHSLVLLENGDVFSFGRNDNSQLGHGDTSNRAIPTKIESLAGVIAIAAGEAHSLVLSENGGVVYSFGYGGVGGLGHGDTSNRATPTKIESLTGAKALAAGVHHSLVLLENGDVYSFGLNDYGRLGHGDTSVRDTPTKIESLSRVKAITAGNYHSLVLLENGDVYSFGNGGNGQLGHGDQSERSIPTKIESLAGVKAITAHFHSLVLVEPIPVTAVVLHPPELELGVGEEYQLTATVLPENATNLNITWTSSNESVASVDVKGTVQAVSVGEAIITASTEDGGYTATSIVAVKELMSVELYREDFEAGDGGYTVRGDNASWKWGVPTIGPGNASSGINVWATNLTGDYNNNEDSYVTSPEINININVGDMHKLSLSWNQWLGTEGNYDYASVEVRKDGSDSWQRVYGEVSGSVNTAWTERIVELDPSYASDSFQVRFRLRSESSVTSNGYYIDDVKITAYFLDRDTPASDFNKDWEIDLLDLAILAQAYGLMNGDDDFKSKFDLNCDGVINLYDLVILAKQL